MMENNFSNIIESLPIVIFRWKNEENWPVDYVSPNVEELIGYTVDEVLAKEFVFSNLIHPDDLERVEQEVKINSMSEIKDFVHQPYRLITKFGHEIWIKDKTRIIKDENDDIIYYLGFIDDITENYIKELSLKVSEQNYKNLFMNSPIGKVLVNTDGKIMQTNEAFQKMIEYSEDELLNIKIHDLTHPDDLDRTHEVLNTIKNEIPKVYHLQKKYITKTGREIWGNLHINPIFDVNTGEKYNLGIVEDITEIKHQEKKISSQLNLLESLLDSIPGPVFYKNFEGKYIGCNNRFAKLLGKSREEIIGRTAEDFIDSQSIKMITEKDQELIQSSGTQIYDADIIISGKQYSFCFYKSTFLSDDSDSLMVGVMLDIFERKQTELILENINRSLELLSKINIALLLAESIKELFFAITEILVSIGNYPMAWITEIIKTDNEIVDILYHGAYTSEGFISSSDIIATKIDCNSCFICNAVINQKIAQEFDFSYCENCELSKFRKNHYISMINVPIFSNKEALYALNLYSDSKDSISNDEQNLLLDISHYIAYGIDSINDKLEKNYLQDLLTIEKEELKTTVNNIAEGILNTSNNGSIIMANNKALDILELEYDSFAKLKIYDLFYVLDNNDNKSTFNPLDLLLNSQEKASKRRISIITLNNKKKVLEYNISDVISNDGAYKGLVFVFSDITEQIKYESQRSLSQKMESIGQLASGIAHEINTPLQYVGDNTFFLRDAFNSIQELGSFIRNEIVDNEQYSELSKKIRAFLEEIDYHFIMEEIPQAFEGSLSGIEKVSNIVKAMKNFAHSSGKQKALENINSGIEVAVIISKNEWKYSSDLKLELNPDLPMIPCSLDEINQVLLNMIVNAAHAIEERFGRNNPEKGTITIKSDFDDDNVIIEISDTGSGIDKNKVESIFDPFFTTKEVGKGTGQGLAISHDIIVNKHNGSILVDSVKNEGTTFRILLPRKEK